MVVFIADGSNLRTAKSFKYNLMEIFARNPVKADTSVVGNQINGATFVRAEDEFCQRALYKLLEDCSRILNRQKRFEVIYTAEGVRINTLAKLKALVQQKVP